MVKLCSEIAIKLEQMMQEGYDDNVVYVKNNEDDQYYIIKDIRIDEENDIVLDIQISDI